MFLLLKDPMGTVECTLAEVIAAKGRFQRALSPYIETPGDCGILVNTFYALKKLY